MQKLDNAARVLIQGKIADIERQTQGELVCLMTRQSARYVLFPLLMAAFTALFLPVLELVSIYAGYHEFQASFELQTIIFVILAGLFVLTPIRYMLTPRWIKQQNCSRYSPEQFFAHRLHETQDKSAILLFVSWHERYVTVVADKGINEKVDQDVWDSLIREFTEKVRKRQVETGFLEMIEKSGELLITNFPAKDINEDELPNHLIDLDGPVYIS